jgi:hypothetical protein
MGRVQVDGKRVIRAGFQFIRHNNKNESVLKSLKSEAQELDTMHAKSGPFGTKFKTHGDEVVFLETK